MPEPRNNQEQVEDAEEPNAPQDGEQRTPVEQEGEEGSEPNAEGQEGEEGVEDAGAGGEGEEEPQQTRGQTRHQRLAIAAQEANDRAAKVEREFNEFKAQHTPRPQQEDPAQEEARMALMSPEERTNYRLDKAERRNQQQMAVLHFQTQDGIDKASFDAKREFDPLVKKHADEVERRLADIRKNGMDAKRDAILTYILGESVRKQGTQKKVEQADRGQQNIRRQQVSVANNKGDTASNRGKTPKTAEDRLANVTF